MEVKGLWKSSNIGGGLDHPTWRSNPQYVLDVGESAEVTISLQLDKSQNDKEDDVKESVGFAVIKKAGPGVFSPVNEH